MARGKNAVRPLVGTIHILASWRSSGTDPQSKWGRTPKIKWEIKWGQTPKIPKNRDLIGIMMPLQAESIT